MAEIQSGVGGLRIQVPNGATLITLRVGDEGRWIETDLTPKQAMALAENLIRAAFVLTGGEDPR